MSDDLINAQNKMTEMLYHLDKFCKQENINYWIDAGSLLGAVRHQGFIPWDDDIDVCMSREDYNKFISYAPRAIKNDLFIQTIYSDPEYPKIHIPCKLRMDTSLHVEKDEIEYGLGDENDYHRGLFIDIFPYDKYSKNVFFRKNIERLLSKIYRIKFLSFLGDNIKGNKCYLQKIGRLIPLKILSKILSVQTSLMNKRKENYYFAAGCEVPFERALFENDEIFPLDRINFNGIEVNCPNKTHEYLVKMFGNNYMELPPLSQRETHHAILKVY